MYDHVRNNLIIQIAFVKLAFGIVSITLILGIDIALDLLFNSWRDTFDILGYIVRLPIFFHGFFHSATDVEAFFSGAVFYFLSYSIPGTIAAGIASVKFTSSAWESFRSGVIADFLIPVGLIVPVMLFGGGIDQIIQAEISGVGRWILATSRLWGPYAVLSQIAIMVTILVVLSWYHDSVIQLYSGMKTGFSGKPLDWVVVYLSIITAFIVSLLIINVVLVELGVVYLAPEQSVYN